MTISQHCPLSNFLLEFFYDNPAHQKQKIHLIFSPGRNSHSIIYLEIYFNKLMGNVSLNNIITLTFTFRLVTMHLLLLPRVHRVIFIPSPSNMIPLIVIYCGHSCNIIGIETKQQFLKRERKIEKASKVLLHTVSWLEVQYCVLSPCVS